jgi:hypothetical protein
MFKTKALVHSLQALDEVIILHENGPNDVIAEYKGKRCSAIYNVFVGGLYYVDDIYGVLPNQHKCPSCGEFIPDLKGVAV